MKNILFITSTRIGDAVLSSGLLGHLAARHGESRITVACGVLPAPLMAMQPNVVKVIALKKRRFSLHWVWLWLQCVFTRWDMVVDLRGTALSWFLWTRERRGMWRRNRGSALHRVAEMAEVLDLDQPPQPHLESGLREKAEAARRIPSPEKILALAPTANWLGKQWPGENFIGLLEKLTAPGAVFAGFSVAVFSAPNEREAALRVLHAAPLDRRIDLAGTADLATVYACLERCAFFIGNDSGLMHMAAAAGVPTLGLFGPSEESHYGPWGGRSAVVRTPESRLELVRREGFHWTTTGSLMESLSVAAVAKAAEQLWENLGESPQRKG